MLKPQKLVSNNFLSSLDISNDELKNYISKPISTFLHKDKNIFASDYYLEVIRQEIIETFGEDKLYGGGLQ